MKKDVMQAIADTGILPVINITDITTALPLAKAILDGIFAFIRPVITSAEGLCVAITK